MRIIKPKFSLKLFLYLIPLSFAICIVGNIIINILPVTKYNQVSKEIFDMMQNGKLLNAVLIVGVVSPIVEELFFRLFLYYLVKRFFGDRVAIVTTSIAFAVAHMNIQQGIYAFFAGLIIGYVRYVYNSIFCPIFVHILINGLTLIFGNYFISGLPISECLFMLLIGMTMLSFSLYRIHNILKEEGFKNEVS